MNIRKVLRFMKDRSQGFDWDEFYGPTEEEDTELSGDAVPVGVMSTRIVTNGRGAEVECWTPPKLKAEGTHRPPRKNRGAGRSYVSYPGNNSEIGNSSTLETKCSYHLMAIRRIVDIVDQSPTVGYVDDDGIPRQTRYDFRFTTDDGRNAVVAVKKSSSVKRKKLERILKLTSPALREQGFDEAIILTELELTDARFWNNKSILRARRARRQKDIDFILDELRDWNGAFNYFELASRHRSVARGEVAIWNLIYEGVLRMVDPAKMLVDAPFVYVDKDAVQRLRVAPSEMEVV